MSEVFDIQTLNDEFESKRETAYIAASQYYSITEKPFGIGVVGSWNEDVARNDCVHRDNLNTGDYWFTISIPPRYEFAELYKPLHEQTPYVKNSLLSDASLGMLFYADIKAFKLVLDHEIETLPESERLSAAQEKIDDFYDSKRELLKSFPDMLQLFLYILERVRDHNPRKASSFMGKYGVKGFVYKDVDNNERFFVFDAKKDIVYKDQHRKFNY